MPILIVVLPLEAVEELDDCEVVGAEVQAEKYAHPSAVTARRER
jgi:hypothetical protein